MKILVFILSFSCAAVVANSAFAKGSADPDCQPGGPCTECGQMLIDKGFEKSRRKSEKKCSEHSAEHIALARKMIAEGYQDSFGALLNRLEDLDPKEIECALKNPVMKPGRPLFFKVSKECRQPKKK